MGGILITSKFLRKLIMDKLNNYNAYVKLIIKGETEEDALDTLYSAVDMCDLLDQDGIVGIEVIDDIELNDDELEEEE